MHKGRIEAFTDGVVAILITIMVLELKVPEEHDMAALRPLLPVFAAYVLSFVNIGIYWANHHHMFQAVERVDGTVLWANLHLLFWLSLIPFTTAFMDESEFGRGPVLLYGLNLLATALAYTALTMSLRRIHRPDSAFARALGSDRKGLLSLGLYTSAILLAFVATPLSLLLIATVAAIWLVPDLRFARQVAPHAADR